MTQSTSTIRVFVQWSEPTVFAGEDVGCQITFKNIAAAPGTSRSPASASSSTAGAGSLSLGDRHRKPVASSHAADSQERASNASDLRSIPPSRGHRSTMSLNVAPSPRPQRADAQPANDTGAEAAIKARANGHRRSVSIISLGGKEPSHDVSSTYAGESPRIPPRKHGRAASLQILPRRPNLNGSSSPSGSVSHRAATHPSPLFQNHSSSETPAFLSPGSTRNGSPTTPDSLNLHRPRAPARRKPRSPSQHGSMGQLPNATFRFPASPAPPTDPQTPQHAARNDHSEGISDQMPPNGHLSPQHKADTTSQKPPLSLSTRIISPTANGETPRNSGELYSPSNHSTETLTSEYIPQKTGLLGSRSAHARRFPATNPPSQYRPAAETLMMGYAQIQGSFTLDGSLVNQEPFEEVKRKGVVGGQGGGVIGVEKNRKENSLLRGFGWGNISESLGGLLGGDEFSSMKDMRGMANSKSIPLLSTPQSILFVDLKLGPGESKAFHYSFKLPKGLPPSHRGKAVKISYQLVLGTQRPGGSKEQHIKSVEIPFRVLGSVNEHGELLGHDLTSPYIILRDQASVTTYPNSSQSSGGAQKLLKAKASNEDETSTLDGFLTYVDSLLASPQQQSGLPLPSRTAAFDQRRVSSNPVPTSAKEAIDFAILRSNLATDTQQSANRFEIARGGKRVAVITLARPAYRLGETVTATIEFADAEIACYAMHASLESCERVDQSLALRSDSSINRVTRRVHASHSESALFARRIVISLSIPVTSTPTFITSGIYLDWKIVIEFVTPRVNHTDSAPDGALLEEVSRDERGAALAAAEVLNCESFEIAVPLRVYGALASSDDKREGDVEPLKI